MNAQIFKRFVSNAKPILDKLQSNKRYYFYEVPIVTGGALGVICGGIHGYQSSPKTIKRTTITNFTEEFVSKYCYAVASCIMGAFIGVSAGFFWPISICVFVAHAGERLVYTIKNK